MTKKKTSAKRHIIVDFYTKSFYDEPDHFTTPAGVKNFQKYHAHSDSEIVKIPKGMKLSRNKKDFEKQLEKIFPKGVPNRTNVFRSKIIKQMKSFNGIPTVKRFHNQEYIFETTDKKLIKEAFDFEKEFGGNYIFDLKLDNGVLYTKVKDKFKKKHYKR